MVVTIDSYARVAGGGQLSAAIQRTFRSFDTDGNGTLDMGELRAAFASMVRAAHRTVTHWYCRSLILSLTDMMPR